MVLITTSKPTFLPWSLFVMLLTTLYDHMFMYVVLFVYSAVVFRVFIPTKAFVRDYVITGVGLSVCLFVCLFVCYHDN